MQVKFSTEILYTPSFKAPSMANGSGQKLVDARRRGFHFEQVRSGYVARRQSYERNEKSADRRTDRRLFAFVQQTSRCTCPFVQEQMNVTMALSYIQPHLTCFTEDYLRKQQQQQHRSVDLAWPVDLVSCSVLVQPGLYSVLVQPIVSYIVFYLAYIYNLLYSLLSQPILLWFPMQPCIYFLLLVTLLSYSFLVTLLSYSVLVNWLAYGFQYFINSQLTYQSLSKPIVYTQLASYRVLQSANRLTQFPIISTCFTVEYSRK